MSPPFHTTPSPPPTLYPHPPTLFPSHTSSFLPLTLHPPHGRPPYPCHPQAAVHVRWPTVHQVELEVTPEDIQQILYDVCTAVKELCNDSTSDIRTWVQEQSVLA